MNSTVLFPYNAVLSVLILTSINALAMEQTVKTDDEINYLGFKTKLKKEDMVNEAAIEALSQKMIKEFKERITKSSAQKVLEKCKQLEKNLESSTNTDKEQREQEHALRQLVSEVPKELIDFPLLNNAPLLHFACSIGSIPLITAVLNQGADVNAYNQNCQTPLFTVVTSGLENEVRKKLITFLVSRGARINMTNLINDERSSALSYSSYYDDTKFVEFLFSQGAVVDNSDIFLSPLYTAAQRSDDNPEIAALLIKHGAQVALGKDTGEVTALSAATDAGNKRIAALLLKAEEAAPVLAAANSQAKPLQASNTASGWCVIF